MTDECPPSETEQLRAEVEKWKCEAATAWQGQEAGSVWNWELKATNDLLEADLKVWQDRCFEVQGERNLRNADVVTLRAENERLKDENHQLRLLLRPIEVNHAALEPHPDAQQPPPQGETTAVGEGG